MGILNSAMTWLFNVIFFPLKWMGPIWALAVVSVLVGVLMVWIFGKTSNQEAIGLVRDKIRGNMIGIRLFGDNLGVLMRLQGRVLTDNLIYMKYALIPMLVLIVPVVLILVQLDLRYTVRPLEPGSQAIVKVIVNDPPALKSVQLEAPQGVVVETPGVHIPLQREVTWRIRADEPGRHELTVVAGANRVTKELQVGGGWGPISRVRTGGPFLDKLLHPGEPTIGRAQSIESIEVVYPPLKMSFLGFGIHWLVFFFIASIVAGFALRKPLGVEL